MNVSNIISLLGGVALFLFGMALMGDGLKRVAGKRLELILYKLSSTPVRGILLGTGVTGVIQSSCATSVMVVGFVNSNMMRLRQAISVILGSILGTSVTGWLLCLSYVNGTGWASLLSTATISALVAVVGIILRMFTKSQTNRHLGDILLGFSVLMFGMQSMSGAVAPLKESERFIQLLTAFSNPFLGILAGAVFTAMLQSASAAVGILQALSATGAMTYAAAFPIILGIGIGAATPVLFSAIGARADGKRAAYSYLVIELLGAIIFAPIFYGLDLILDFSFMDAVMSPVSIAMVNMLFRGVKCAFMLPLLGWIESLVCSFVAESEQEKAANAEFERLDERFLAHPSLAIEQSRLAVISMAKTVMQNLHTSVSLLDSYSEEGFAEVEQREDLVDRFEDKIGTYLVKLTAHELDRSQNECVSKYLHTLSDFERVSDHAMNIAETAQEMAEKKITFSGAGAADFEVLVSAVGEILELSISAFCEDNVERAYRVEPLEQYIDVLCDEMKLHHIERVQNGECSLSHGFVFNDLLTNLERVSDHCSNIAIAVIELRQDQYDAHGYVINLKELHEHNYYEYYAEYAEKYRLTV